MDEERELNKGDNEDIEVDDEQSNENATKEESFRVKIANLPLYIKHQQAKKLITSRLANIELRKLRVTPGVAYFSLFSLDDTLKAVELLNNFEYREKTLVAKRVADEKVFRPPTKDVVEDTKSKTANEISAPLFNLSYEEQLKLKFEDAKKTCLSLVKQLGNANVSNARYIKVDKLLEPIVRSPIVTGYRNKCEFTIGIDTNSEPCIGFVSGKMANRMVTVVPVDDSVLVTENMRQICSVFTDIVKQSGLAPFNEFDRSGFWKRLTIRDFSGDCMIIATVHSLEDEEKVKQIKDTISNTFLTFGDLSGEYKFSVRSVFWQVHENASDPFVFEHIGGVPYVYETILGVRFQISPYTFFQTNSRGCELLYTAIGDFLGLPKENEKIEQEAKTEQAKSINLLDICCGAGTIGQCQLRRIERAIQRGVFKGSYSCIGVELIEQAVNDARRNAEDNGFSKEKCRYVSGDAEIVFRHVNQYFNIDPKDEQSIIVGILDPPRAGLSTKVITSCRKLEKMRKLIYVSCDPRSALKNIVDLCRPESKRYDGNPFTVQQIRPVDMFPNTKHLEWVILLTR